MNRCIAFLSLFFFAAIGANAPFLIPSAQAQTIARYGIRAFPPDVVRGKMKVIASNIVELGGQEEMLPPGVRIWNLNNQLIQTNRLAGSVIFRINYRRDAAGWVKEIWLLSAAEAEQKIVKNPAQIRPLAVQKRRAKLRNQGRYEDLPTFEESTTSVNSSRAAD